MELWGNPRKTKCKPQNIRGVGSTKLVQGRLVWCDLYQKPWRRPPPHDGPVDLTQNSQVSHLAAVTALSVMVDAIQAKRKTGMTSPQSQFSLHRLSPLNFPYLAMISLFVLLSCLPIQIVQIKPDLGKCRSDNCVDWAASLCGCCLRCPALPSCLLGPAVLQAASTQVCRPAFTTFTRITGLVARNMQRTVMLLTMSTCFCFLILSTATQPQPYSTAPASSNQITKLFHHRSGEVNVTKVNLQIY